ncbi:hypothetical protein AMJ87_11655 [candidate division WOR_3 bacterium SM23_60]|uniref:CinA C-terminal domain-containing protein n=1 Tax=candidate division WOR_3 bacterium SM23_60 TaxID=1703780 RepID=A0A0S8G7N6_UNCW3|nr:MAG: hypothetical protein AMJ87_11655 [candidate division WOR_3 bacterium SM23_60]
MTRRAVLTSLARQLLRKKLTISVCESCTGGMLGSMITDRPGSSKYFVGGIIAYSNEVKRKVIGVKPATLRKYGSVSAEVVKEMARGVRRKLITDIGIAITGIAGPAGGSKKKPVGLVYLGVASKQKVSVKMLLLKGSRDTIRKKACTEALYLLIDCL